MFDFNDILKGSLLPTTTSTPVQQPRPVETNPRTHIDPLFDSVFRAAPIAVSIIPEIPPQITQQFTTQQFTTQQITNSYITNNNYDTNVTNAFDNRITTTSNNISNVSNNLDALNTQFKALSSNFSNTDQSLTNLSNANQITNDKLNATNLALTNYNNLLANNISNGNIQAKNTQLSFDKLTANNNVLNNDLTQLKQSNFTLNNMFSNIDNTVKNIQTQNYGIIKDQAKNILDLNSQVIENKATINMLANRSNASFSSTQTPLFSNNDTSSGIFLLVLPLLFLLK